jgi:two-component system sensor histidine kinase PilS (NtrC family)
LDDLADLRRRLVWVNVFRVVATTLFLIALALRLMTQAAAPEVTREDSISFALIGIVYFVTLAYGLFLRFGLPGRALAYAQIIGDVVLASALVYVTGGLESPFTFVYLLAIVAASTLLFQRGAFVAAMASATAFAGVTVAIQRGYLRVPSGRELASPEHFGFALASNLLAHFLLAALAGYLSRQLRTAGGRLSQREADLQRLSVLQEQILACMPSGLLTCDDAGAITFINPAGRAILSIAPEEAELGTLSQRFPGVERLGHAAPRAELEVGTAQGPKMLGVTITPLEGREGHALLVFQDLTQLRRVEEELRRADRLAALGRLSAQLAHEIRNPLASMRGSAQMLAAEVSPDGAPRRLTTILIRESDRLSTLVEDFLRFARPPQPTLRPTSAKQLVVETLEVLSADPLARGVTIETRLTDVSAMLDADQMRQVLMNLLRNAFAAVGGTGTVRVTTEAREGHVRVRVWDSAGAIAPADRLRIFEPFFSKKAGGTGLGLSTAHAIVHAHGGTLQVSSAPGAGTDFTVDIPLRAEASVADSGR